MKNRKIPEIRCNFHHVVIPVVSPCLQHCPVCPDKICHRWQLCPGAQYFKDNMIRMVNSILH